MSRRHSAEKREIIPDPKFGDVVVTKFMNSVMYEGKKSTAERIVYDALAILAERTGKEPVEALEISIKSLTPVLEVRSRRVGGATYQVPVEVPARSTVTVPVPPDLAAPRDAADELLVAAFEHETAMWFYAEPRESALTEPDLSVEVTPTEHGALVRVTTDTLVRGLTLLVDKVHPEAVVDEMLIDLLAGESTTFRVVAPVPLDAAALASAQVLRSVNQLVRPREGATS